MKEEGIHCRINYYKYIRSKKIDALFEDVQLYFMRYPLLDKVKGNDSSQASQSDKFPEKRGDSKAFRYIFFLFYF